MLPKKRAAAARFFGGKTLVIHCLFEGWRQPHDSSQDHPPNVLKNYYKCSKKSGRRLPAFFGGKTVVIHCLFDGWQQPHDSSPKHPQNALKTTINAPKKRTAAARFFGGRTLVIHYFSEITETMETVLFFIGFWHINQIHWF